MRRLFQIAVFVFALLVFQLPVLAQSNQKSKLQQEYNKILNEIKEIEGLLNKTKTEKEESLNQLQSLNRKISSRASLLKNIQEQVVFIDKSITEKNGVVASMNKDLEALKESYGNMVYNSYKNLHTKNKLSFIFSSSSFNQALQRFNYLRTYSSYRQNQAALIDKTIVDIQSKVALLEEDKKDKIALLGEEQKQTEVLASEKLKQNEMLNKLQNDEANLQAQAKQKNKDAEKLNNKIAEIIAEEIRLAKEKAAKANAGNNTASTPKGMGLTPEEKQLSSTFVSNMGKLPWPVEKGHILTRFGKNPHPTIDKVYINNNGLDIRTEEGASVRAVFEGTVIQSFYLATSQNSVIVKHGEYYTVYSNLETVSVKAGEKISTKQSIGRAYTNESDQNTKVHLEIWKGTEKTNPELWLVK